MKNFLDIVKKYKPNNSWFESNVEWNVGGTSSIGVFDICLGVWDKEKLEWVYGNDPNDRGMDEYIDGLLEYLKEIYNIKITIRELKHICVKIEMLRLFGKGKSFERWIVKLDKIEFQRLITKDNVFC